MSDELDDLDFDNIEPEQEPVEDVPITNDDLKDELRKHFDAAETTFAKIHMCEHDQARIKNLADTMQHVIAGYTAIAALLK